MKVLLYLAVFFSSLSSIVMADSYACGLNGLQDEKTRVAYRFLESIQGRYQLGRCFVELQMCNSNETMQSGGVVGDLGVTDRYGQFFYVKFDFSMVQTEKVKKVIMNGRRMVHYEYIGRLPDEANGRTEAYRLEILKSEDLTRVESLDLGVFTSRLNERYPRVPPGKSYWVRCGNSQEGK